MENRPAVGISRFGACLVFFSNLLHRILEATVWLAVQQR